MAERENRNHYRNNQRKGKNRSNRQRGKPRYRNHQRDDRRSTPPPVGDGTVEPFELFCSLHLHITHDNRYRSQSMQDIARRFGVSVAELQVKIHELGMDVETVKQSGFDMEMAQMDIKVAPVGISRFELARPWFEEFQKHLPQRPVAAKEERKELPQDLVSPIFDEEQ